ncbi:MAG: calpastatin [Pseudonocardiales bacterium]|nr:calpastatin [Pseudonocardiales bacterium]
MSDDPYDLARFVSAQAGIYDQAVSELRRGLKTSHWMWFIFPQIAGLGRSAMAQRYAISGLDEARAYLQHEVLGPRLIDAADIVNRVTGRSAEQIFGGIDAQKLHSSMTLFHRAAPDEAVFGDVLDHYFDGVADTATDDRLD